MCRLTVRHGPTRYKIPVTNMMMYIQITGEDKAAYGISNSTNKPLIMATQMTPVKKSLYSGKCGDGYGIRL